MRTRLPQHCSSFREKDHRTALSNYESIKNSTLQMLHTVPVKRLDRDSHLMLSLYFYFFKLIQTEDINIISMTGGIM